MSNILILNQSYVSSGLVTETFTIPAAGLYNVKGDITEIPPSSLSIVVTQNGSPVYTAPALTITQSAMQFKTELVCAASDAIVVTLSSSAPIDNALNNIKSIISIGQGQ